MLLISHRGNISGANPEKENDPDYIAQALFLGYNVEIDVWKIDDEWFLGHDFPFHKINFGYLVNDSLLCHAKNLPALNDMLKDDKIHCFWHQEDHYTITSRGYIVSYPGYSITDKTICMKPEMHIKSSLEGCYAICSDYVEKYK